MNDSPVRVGLLGCGTVGSALISLLQRQHDAIAARTGLDIAVTRVAVRDLSRPRDPGLPAEAFTDDPAAVVADPDIDLVVEVMGGIEPAGALVQAALAAGRPVITANKALLAEHGAELFALADRAGVDLLFEAAVAGGIPFIRPLRESLLGEPVRRVMGIMNGTTNYILTRMTEAGADYAEALAEAQALGFAEADPTADVGGFDAGAKIAIVASIAFGCEITASMVDVEGITAISADDIAFASRSGHVIKLLAVAERVETSSGPQVSAAVHPVLVPVHHPLASVRESFNAVFVEGDAVGELMFYGRGAGGDPTASAVLGDLIDAAVNLRRGAHASIGALAPARLRPAADAASAQYLSLVAVDRPGVLAAIASVLGDNGISIASMSQSGPDSELGGGLAEDEARIDLITHRTGRRQLDATLAALRSLDAVRRVGSVVRVLSDEDDDV
ncbi:MAG: homoserine dehydrogenase [Acidobacteria bacterium]|nr:homoserine dehydrogenase [Acidobacteriota bacterium]